MDFQKYKSVIKKYYLDSKIMPSSSKFEEVDGDITAMFHKKVKLLSIMRVSLEMCSSCSMLSNSLSHSFTSSNSFNSFKDSDESPLTMVNQQP